MQNIDPITIILFIPVLDRFIYPWLRRIGVPLKPISRITLGFIFGALAMMYAAYVQQLIYGAPPCFANPLTCEAAKLPDGTIVHNKVNVLVQTPAYCLIALSEIFASVTGLEYAYTQAPSSMKSFVQALFLLTSAVGAAIAATIAPFAKDPRLTWLYIGLATISLLVGCIFWILFRNKDEAEVNAPEDIPLGQVDCNVQTEY
jgi:proton-dependent oligopeptide transporter, POT family